MAIYSRYSLSLETLPVINCHNLYSLVNYRPQRSCGKVMFSQASGQKSPRIDPPGHTSPGQTPPGQAPPGRHPQADTHWADTPPCPVHARIHTPSPQRPLQRMVRILLECILVHENTFHNLFQNRRNNIEKSNSRMKRIIYDGNAISFRSVGQHLLRVQSHLRFTQLLQLC